MSAQPLSFPSNCEVFISYSRKNRDFAAKLVDALRAKGREAWIDLESIPPSAEWWDEIKRGIDSANTFVPILTPETLSSPICTFEMDYALKNNKRIVPVMHVESSKTLTLNNLVSVDPTGFLAEILGDRDLQEIALNNWRVVEKLNWVRMTQEDDFEDALNKLLYVLNIDLESVRLHTRLLVRAREWEARNRDASLLLVGSELREATDWLTKDNEKKLPATVEQKALIELSIEQEEQLKAQDEQRKEELRSTADRAERQRRRARTFTTVALIVGVIAIASAVIAGIQTNNLSVQDATLTPVPVTLTAIGQTADSARLTSSALHELSAPNANSELAALLAIRALTMDYTSSADYVLTTAIDGLYTIQRIPFDYTINTVVFSPNGEYVLTAGHNPDAFVWNAAEFIAGNVSSPIVVLHGHTGNIFTAAFSPDSQLVVTGGSDNTARVWDVTTGQLLLTFTGHTDVINHIAVSPDGQYVASASDDVTAQIWDIRTGETRYTLTGHTTSVDGVDFSPDGSMVVTGSFDGSVRLWDAVTGEHIRTLLDDDSAIPCVSFSPDGRYVAAGSFDKTARIWNTNSGELLMTLSGHTGFIRTLVFSSDSRFLLTGSDDNTARLWDISTGRTANIYSGHDGEIMSVAFSSNSSQALTASSDHTVRVIDVRAPRLNNSPVGEQVNRILLNAFNGHTNVVRSAQFSPDGRYVLTGSLDGTVRLWDAATLEEVRRIQENGAVPVSSVAFSPDGQLAASASLNGTISLWHIPDGMLLRTFIGEHDIDDIAFSPDGSRIVSGNIANTAQLWEIATGELILTFTGHTDAVASVAYSPNGQYVLTGSLDDTARLWDASTGDLVHTFEGHTSDLMAVAFSPDGRYILTGGVDNEARLWDVSSGDVVRTFIGHTEDIDSVAFSPDGSRIVTGSADKTVRLWDVSTGQILRTLGGHTEAVDSVTFSSDGQHILTGSLDTTARLYETGINALIAYACTQVFRDFTAFERQQYGIGDDPTCPQFGDIRLPSTSTPLATPTIPVFTLAPEYATSIAAPPALTVEAIDLETVAGTLVYGAENGDQRGEGLISIDGVTLADFILEIRLSTQIESANDVTWQYLIGFRSDANAGGYGIFIDNEGRWMLSFTDEQNEASLAGFGYISRSDMAINGNNAVRLVVVGDSGLLQFNGETVAALDLSRFQQPGSLSIYVRPGSSSAMTHYEGLSVWQIGDAPIVPPTPVPLPTATPGIAQAAQVGENSGEIPTGGGQLWSYDGIAGEVLTITTVADWDTTLKLLRSGRRLEYNDDGEGLPNYNSRISFTLPESGEYIIEVRSLANLAGGAYTLILESDRSAVLPTTPYTFSQAGAVLVENASGELLHDAANGRIEFYDASVAAADFLTEVRLYNPYDANVGDWTYGLLFRAVSGTHYRLVLTSNGEWRLILQVDEGTVLQSGQIPEFDTSDGGSNRIRLEAEGAHGAFYVNDLFVSNLDLSANLSQGTIAVGTGFYPDTEIAGEVTRFEDLRIQQIGIPPTLTPTATLAVRHTAQVGENIGQIKVGGGEVWTYEGHAGEALVIRVMADLPAGTQTNAVERAELGLLDTRMILRGPSGFVVENNDDELIPEDDPERTNSRIEVILPADGTYEIEVRSYADESGGSYTLVVESHPD